MPNNLHTQYEKLHLQNIVKSIRRIRAMYGSAIDRITITANGITFKGVVFQLKDYPLLKAHIDAEIKKLHGSILFEISDTVKAGWALSNEKNDKMVDARLGGKTPTNKARIILYDPNKPALNEFVKRKEKGLNLSARVWKALEPFKPQLEQGLAVGINEGKSAAQMARDLKQYLNDPDKLFRRVRDAEGQLKLSRAAKNYHPGQGVYRSSFKNALRLTASETNTAYRTADFNRWQALSFITGIEVKTSGSHPKFDICDVLAGFYPKDFLFTGFHPQCICYAIPKMATEAEYDKLEDSILGITNNPPDIKEVTDIPQATKAWLKNNKERIGGWSSKPHWITNNPEYVK